MLYLYGITKRTNDRFEGISGIDYAPLSTLSYNGLTAIVSEKEAFGLEPSAKRLWQHEFVVEHLMAQGTVLPVRFATTFPDVEAVRRYLKAFEEVIHTDLDHVSGHVALSLRVIQLWGPGSGDGAVAEGELCFDLLDSEKREHAFDVACRSAKIQQTTYHERIVGLAEVCSRSLEVVSSDFKVDVGDRSGVLLKASYLVDRDRLAEMQATVRGLMKAYPQMQFLCTGPWPPYHFVHSPV